IGRCRGGDEADVGCDRGERAHQGKRLETQRRDRPFPDVDVVRAEGRIGIRVEEEIEPAALTEPRDLEVMLKALAGIRLDIGVAPGRDMMAGSADKETEFHHRDRTLPERTSVRMLSRAKSSKSHRLRAVILDKSGPW